MPDERPQVMAQKNFIEHRDTLTSLDLHGRFAYIYEQNLWGNNESRSGFGSTSVETETLRKRVPELLHDLGVRSILDIPCGDFAWMSQIPLNLSYIGADIVDELVEANRSRYGSDTRRFHKLDLTQDSLPQADLVLCRDCLVHLCYDNIRRAFNQIRLSGARYLLMTHFLELEINNDIEDGDWRPLNYQLAPFHFPTPDRVIIENCIEADGAYQDKTLALWKLAEIPTDW